MSTALTTVQGMLSKQAPKLRKVFGKQADLAAMRFNQLLKANPNLLNCDPDSLSDVVKTLLTYDLEVGSGSLAEAYPVPFGTRCQLIVGYRGLIKLAFQAGWQVRLESVHEGDEFEQGDLFSVPKHVHGPGNRHARPLTHAYLVAKNIHNPAAMLAVNVWTKDRCIAHRDLYSQTWKRVRSDKQREDLAWNEAHPKFYVMCMKTVMRDAVARGLILVSSHGLRDQLTAENEEHTVESVVIAEQPQITVEDVQQTLERKYEQMILSAKSDEDLDRLQEVVEQESVKADNPDWYESICQMIDVRRQSIRLADQTPTGEIFDKGQPTPE